LSRDGTKQRIQRLNDALDKYALDHDGHYPSTRQGLEAIYVKPEDDAAWHGPYGEGQDRKLKDAWDQPLRYGEPSAESGSRSPTVWSVGPDKAPDTSDDIR
jgi:general secretion pathway protein G